MENTTNFMPPEDGRAMMICKACGHRFFIKKTVFSIFRKVRKCPLCGSADIKHNPLIRW